MNYTENELATIICDLGLKVHRRTGPGLLESAYEECLYYELTKKGLQVERQINLPFVYEEIRLNAGYRLDLLVENKVIVEIKAVNDLQDIHTSQLLTYLKLSDKKLGLLINFNVKLFKHGIKRVANGYLD
ncbi:MAG: GxxExxY protein [Fluviicola sp.]|jgi:GxxExxY protein